MPPGSARQVIAEVLGVPLESISVNVELDTGKDAWSIASGTLPPGLALGNGVISGTPTTEGSYEFVVRATLDPTRTDTETLRLDVRQPVTIAAPAVAPKSELGASFSMRLSASGGTGTFTWAVADGALPSGLLLGTDGTISGTPTGVGTFRFTASATDTEGRVASYPGLLTVAPRLAISTLTLRPGKVGKLYRAKLKATGGVVPKTWKVKSGRFPTGVRLDRTLGVISGTPKKAGRYRITVEAEDGVVTLEGTTALDRAIEVARTVPGVRDVRTQQVEIPPIPPFVA